MVHQNLWTQNRSGRGRMRAVGVVREYLNVILQAPVMWLRTHKAVLQWNVQGYSKWLSEFQQLVIHNTLGIEVYSCTDRSRKSQSFLVWCAVCSSYAFLCLEHSLLRWWSDAACLATSFSRYNPMWFLSMGLHQGSGLCSYSSRKYPGTEGTNQNCYWNHHRWHATNSLEWTRLSCWCLQNHKWCTYRAPVRYVTKTWGVVQLNKKIHILLSEVYCVWQVVKTPTII